MEEKQIHDDLSSIRSLMERSSKFISLSGLSGILAGVYALIGVAVVYFLPKHDMYVAGGWHTVVYPSPSFGALFITAVVILIASVATAVLLTIRKAKKKGQAVWGSTSRLLLFNMAVPIVAGGIFILIMIARGEFEMIIPSSLIFYGLSLLGASNFTFGDVKYLGILEVVLGLAAAMFPVYGPVLWAMGFGVLHIIYGSIMYFKYDG